jgi:hypothetical protein
VVTAGTPSRWQTSRVGLCRPASNDDHFLRGIDITIVTFLEGAWDDVQRSGSAAPSKIAHCVVEAVDHTLRALAPPDAVRQWLHRDGRKPAKGDPDETGPSHAPSSCRLRAA